MQVCNASHHVAAAGGTLNTLNGSHTATAPRHQLYIGAWQNTLNLLHAIPLPPIGAAGAAAGNEGGADTAAGRYHEVRLRIDVELVLVQVWWALGAGGPWTALPAFEGGSRGSGEPSPAQPSLA